MQPHIRTCTNERYPKYYSHPDSRLHKYGRILYFKYISSGGGARPLRAAARATTAVPVWRVRATR